jgi:gliding motility-associated-like protein
MKKYINIMFGLFLCLQSVSYAQQQYDASKAIKYAERWWNDFNIEDNYRYMRDTFKKWGGPYINYSEYGGDCAAFVSQCLIYGGLDLSAGSNGNGSYVKEDGVISGVAQLIQHLKDIQGFKYEKITNHVGRTEPSFVLPGDPVFLSGNGAYHSIFCVNVENGKNVYNSHSSAQYHMVKDYWNHRDANCFHIGVVPVTTPEHCENCQRDGDETGVDCGGSCPPCEDAPQQRNISGTVSSSTEYRALENVSTSGNVVIKSGADVKLLSGSSIELGPGFEIENGATMSADVTTDRNKLTRNYRKVCYSFPDVFTPNGDGINDIYRADLAGVLSVNISIVDRLGRLAKSVNVDVNEDGYVYLWDGTDGRGKNFATGAYFFTGEILGYDGETREVTGSIAILR